MGDDVQNTVVFILDFAIAAFVAVVFVTVEFDLATLLFLLWLVGIFLILRRSSRHQSKRMIAGRFALHMFVMALIITAAVFAPGKRIDEVLHRPVQLKKNEMRLSELEEYCNEYSRHSGGGHFPLKVSISRNSDTADDLVQFPSDQITLKEFINAIESQTRMRHTFAGCGNAYTILKGPAYNFGLLITDPNFRPAPFN